MKYRFNLLIMASAVFCLSLAAVASADSVVKTLYVDGNEFAQGSAGDALSFSYCCITIGAEGNRNFRYNGYEGLIDEFAIYAGVLDATRIAAHYNAPNDANYVAAVMADNPLLYFRFEDANDANGAPVDNSGSVDVNGTYIGDAVYGDVNLVTGYVGNAADFNGASDGNGTCIDVWDGDGDFSPVDVTIEMWVKNTQATDYPRLFQHNNGGEDGYGVMLNAEANDVGLIGGGTYYINADDANLNDGNWHHVVVTYDSVIISVTDSYPNEVMADDPCLYLRFGDDPNGNRDSSVNNHWVFYSAQGNMSIVDKVGGIGKSVYLDGTKDGHAGVAASAIGDPGWGVDYGDQYAFAPNDITFEFWVNGPEYGSSEPCMAKYGIFFQQIGPWTNEPNAPGVGNDSGQLRILAGNQWWYPGVATPLDRQWHHLVVAYDEEYEGDPNSMGIQLYLDGAAYSKVVTDANGDANLGPEMNHLVIGGENDRGWIYNTYVGYIDEFAIYEGVLSAERVAVHYAAWQPEDCAEVWDRGMGIAADIDKDCDVDFVDFASFALEWVLCNDPCDANCIPNW